jgi:hypothetical protein
LNPFAGSRVFSLQGSGSEPIERDYQLNERSHAADHPFGSPVGNKPLKESRLAEILGTRVLCIIRSDGAVRMPDRR